MGNRALIITWNGFQDQEVCYPYYRLIGAGIETHILADERDSKNRIYGILGMNMPCHIVMQEFRDQSQQFLDEYHLLILPGGVKALEKLRQETSVISFIEKWDKSGKVIASTCHGAQLLISAGIVKNRTISGYYSIKDDIENAGAIYSADSCVVDSNIVSSPHYDHMGIWMEKTLDQLTSRQKNFRLTGLHDSKSSFPSGFEHEEMNLAIDFDGVLHDDFKGYFDGTCYGEPIAGSLNALALLSKKFKIIIFTAKAKPSRPKVDGKTGEQLVWEWLQKHGFENYVSQVTSEKPRAYAYIDDKAIRFSTWSQLLDSELLF